MVLTSLELKDKTFGTKFRGYDPEEVDEFLDIVTEDYEELVRKNHEQEMEIRSLQDRLTYFDELKESLSQSVILAQDTAEKVKIAAKEQASNIIKQAEYDNQSLLNASKDKANDILRIATDNAKKVAVETEELKNKTRVFHQRLKSTIEGHLALVDSPEWEEILRPTASYLQTSDEAFREVLEQVLAESVDTHEDSLEVTRQLSAEEIAELVQQAEALEQEVAQAEVQEETTEE
ncbi:MULTISPECIES: DivIVA domain-containing protein [unclassified Streptococcus]|uniref:DivIVA domain-containing protein n=1 Tax=unclassified Streptococcus TaxID=2608887 RepID=UPI001071CCCE|nr:MULTISPECIES: DivIVA domain-containing protein [unclassified Streptococcus]MBF0786827.1 DivIVA domain-containing protein [Streptococcus sp. 19428wC2_LYSM12]MCQ9211067.1 DivIVA domain-containing protein [Streptococcus sp. B01]MCQ9214342.1 DivIVA domain-containing protein [Streptococcus sp. O1]TFV06370.1 DivIVA domain-containing protein [Streptococcus sp. LYSM12]